MSKSAADSARQLSKLRWPLVVLVVISAGAVAQASWLCAASALAGGKPDSRRNLNELPRLNASEDPAASDESPVVTQVEIAPALPEAKAVAAKVDVAPEPWKPVPSPSVDEPTVVAQAVAVEPELRIVNPANNALRVGFALDGEVLWLAPGESRTYSGAGPWSVAYHRGASFGEDRQTLTAGRYEFSVTEQGWSLSAND